MEERPTGPLLPPAQAPDRRPRRCRCAGLPEGRRGRGYQYRINAIARREMLNAVKSGR